jgi:hypothetical protein
LIWGVKGGVVFAVWPTGFRKEGVGGPRGLFRITSLSGTGLDRFEILLAFSQLQLKCFVSDRAFGPIEFTGQFLGRHVQKECGKQLQSIFSPVTKACLD